MRKSSVASSTFPMYTTLDGSCMIIAAAAPQALAAYQQAEKLSPGSREIEEKVKALKWQLRKQDNGKQRPPQEVRFRLSAPPWQLSTTGAACTASVRVSASGILASRPYGTVSARFRSRLRMRA